MGGRRFDRWTRTPILRATVAVTMTELVDEYCDAALNETDVYRQHRRREYDLTAFDRNSRRPAHQLEVALR